MNTEYRNPLGEKFLDNSAKIHWVTYTFSTKTFWKNSSTLSKIRESTLGQEVSEKEYVSPISHTPAGAMVMLAEYLEERDKNIRHGKETGRGIFL